MISSYEYFFFSFWEYQYKNILATSLVLCVSRREVQRNNMKSLLILTLLAIVANSEYDEALELKRVIGLYKNNFLPIKVNLKASDRIEFMAVGFDDPVPPHLTVSWREDYKRMAESVVRGLKPLQFPLEAVFKGYCYLWLAGAIVFFL